MNEKPTILFTDYYFPYKKKIVKGYLYVENGYITELGEGDPPEDLLHTHIHLPGKNQILLPGNANMLIHVLYYPIRGMIGKPLSFKKTWETLEKLSEKQALSLAKTVIKNLLEKGVTTILSMDPLPHSIIKALKETGVRGIVITQQEKTESPDEDMIKIIQGSPWEHNERIKRIQGENGETKGLFLDGKYVLVKEREKETSYIGTGHETNIDPRNTCIKDDPWNILETLSLNALEFFTKKRFSQGLEKEMPADLYAIQRYSALYTPNALHKDKLLTQLLKDSYHTPYIETVMINGEILVDGGQQLVVDNNVIDDAMKTAGEIIYQLL